MVDIMDVYIALAHHPVRNKRGEEVATAVTNLDIHDLARMARTFGVRGYYIVTPVSQQRSLVGRIISHWVEGEGRAYNPIRAEAFNTVRVAEDIAEVNEHIEQESGVTPVTVVTGAGFGEGAVSYDTLRERIHNDSGSVLLIFGTGWGLTQAFVETCDLKLPGIAASVSNGGYNHLSVRAAVAIILDRLLGNR